MTLFIQTVMINDVGFVLHYGYKYRQMIFKVFENTWQLRCRTIPRNGNEVRPNSVLKRYMIKAPQPSRK